MKSTEWIERAMKKGNFPSYRQLALKLGITEPTMSQHRSGRAKTLSDDHCIIIAEICGIDPAIVIADQQAERASPAVRKIYERMGKLALQAGAAAMAMGTILLGTISNSPAGSMAYATAMAINSILCKIAHRLRISSILRYECCTGVAVDG